MEVFGALFCIMGDKQEVQILFLKKIMNRVDDWLFLFSDDWLFLFSQKTKPRGRLKNNNNNKIKIS